MYLHGALFQFSTVLCYIEILIVGWLGGNLDMFLSTQKSSRSRERFKGSVLLSQTFVLQWGQKVVFFAAWDSNYLGRFITSE